MERPEHPQLSRESRQKTLKIAIIGGGPGGLGVALELARLPFVEWTLYEKKPEISDTGGGIALQPHTWRLLEHNGASQYIGAQDMFRAVDGQREQRRYVHQLLHFHHRHPGITNLWFIPGSTSGTFR